MHSSPTSTFMWILVWSCVNWHKWTVWLLSTPVRRKTHQKSQKNARAKPPVNKTTSSVVLSMEPTGYFHGTQQISAFFFCDFLCAKLWSIAKISARPDGSLTIPTILRQGACLISTKNWLVLPKWPISWQREATSRAYCSISPVHLPDIGGRNGREVGLDPSSTNIRSNASRVIKIQDPGGCIGWTKWSENMRLQQQHYNTSYKLVNSILKFHNPRTNPLMTYLIFIVVFFCSPPLAIHSHSINEEFLGFLQVTSVRQLQKPKNGE